MLKRSDGMLRANRAMLGSKRRLGLVRVREERPSDRGLPRIVMNPRRLTRFIPWQLSRVAAMARRHRLPQGGTPLMQLRYRSA
jgi:hypothetical protein